jgi:hypothetical protein
MSLIQSKSAATAASILFRVKHLAGNYSASVTHLNTIVKDVLALDDSDLEEFCNKLGAVGLNQLTSLHLQHGTNVTNLLKEASATLGESGVQWPTSSVDVRPLGEKLAEQGRELVFSNNKFTVLRFPEPIVEPIHETKPIAEPIVEMEPILEPVIEIKPIVEPIVEPELISDPIVEPIEEPTPEPEQ